MTDKLNEQLSALVDDELTSSEESLLTRQVGKDAGLHARLARYQLISDALRNQLPERIDPGFGARVQAAVRDARLDSAPPHEPAGSGGSRPRGLFKPLAGLAVAASVAVVAVLSLESVRQEPSAPPAVAMAPVAGDYIRADAGRDQPAASAPERNLDIYLVNHNEFAANRGMQGMLPYARIVSHDMSRDNDR